MTAALAKFFDPRQPSDEPPRSRHIRAGMQVVLGILAIVGSSVWMEAAGRPITVNLTNILMTAIQTLGFVAGGVLTVSGGREIAKNWPGGVKPTEAPTDKIVR
jgi:hypothetical protein